MDLPVELVQRLYTVPPEDFLTTRTNLSKEVRDAGDADLAKALTALRKPTVGASVVNRQVHADPECVDRLLELGSRLRVAHEDLDAAAIRDLSTERRTLVGELTAAAFAVVGQDNPSAALRDDVRNSFDAAVADPQIAARLGHLTRPERWSGFGVAMDAPSGTPELTLVRGGKDRRTKARRTPEPATRRRLTRARDKAQIAFDGAEQQLNDAEQEERTADERVRELVAELSRLQGDLDETKAGLERSRRAVKSARGRRREARSALDRAERQAGRGDE